MYSVKSTCISSLFVVIYPTKSTCILSLFVAIRSFSNRGGSFPRLSSLFFSQPPKQAAEKRHGGVRKDISWTKPFGCFVLSLKAMGPQFTPSNLRVFRRSSSRGNWHRLEGVPFLACRRLVTPAVRGRGKRKFSNGTLFKLPRLFYKKKVFSSKMHHDNFCKLGSNFSVW